MASPTTDRRLGLAGNTSIKAPVTVLAASNITQSGEQTIDGVAVFASNSAGVPDRVLCTGMTDATKNGIWDVATGSWTRSVDANGNYDLGQGTTVLVNRGTTYAGSYWKLDTSGSITVGTTSQSWSRALASSLSTLSFSHAFTGAITRSLEDRDREVIKVTDAGVKAGIAYASANCAAYALLAAYVNTRGGHAEIVWPADDDTYYFAPKDNATYSGGAAYAWRAAVELVDVKNCFHVGYGATIHLSADAAWYRGNSTPVLGLDENVIQFRASAQGLCDRVGVMGLKCVTDDTTNDTTTGHADGAAFGISYRGCTNTVTLDPVCNYWGTDGIYYGDGYGAGFGGYTHYLRNPVLGYNHRQGISVVRNNGGLIEGGRIHDTAGGSFGHAIDFEPNSTNTQSGWTLVNTATKDNQRGAFNVINSSDITWINPQIDEQHASTNGAIYMDGSNVAGYTVRNIRFIGGYVQSLQPCLYLTGGNTAGTAIDGVSFDKVRLQCLGNAPASNAWCRINPAGLTNMRIGKFTFTDCIIDGNGGITFKSDGTNEARLTIKGGTWNLKNYTAAALAFTINVATALDVIDIDGVEMTVDASATMATNSPYIIKGALKNCRLSGQAAAIITWLDYGAGRSGFVIGYNEFSAYNYYKGVVANLDLKAPGVIEEPIAGYLGTGRRVHGGLQRVTSYIATPAVFLNRQAPLDGDVCPNITNSAAAVAVTEYIYDGNGSRWRVNKFVTKKGVTASRPTPAAGTAAVDEGIMYLDTTLDADGKPIWWNGAAWVDATGAVV